MTERGNDWLTVLFHGAQAYIVATGDAPKLFKRLDNDSNFRGARRDEASTILRQSRTTRKISTGKTMKSVPIASPTGEIIGAQIASLSSDGGPPPIGVWKWVGTPGDTTLPPQLKLDETALDLLGVSPRHRDRSVYGPADFYTRVVRTGDFVRHRKFLQELHTSGDKYTATVPVLPETGTHGRIHTAEISVEGPEGIVVNGIGWDAGTNTDAIAEEAADATLVRSLARQTGMFALVVDTYYALPYVAQWLTRHPSGIAHGVSTGQPPGIVDEDMPKVLDAIASLQHGGQDSLDIDVRTKTLGGDHTIDTSCTCEVMKTLAQDRTLFLVSFDIPES